MFDSSRVKLPVSVGIKGEHSRLFSRLPVAQLDWSRDTNPSASRLGRHLAISERQEQTRNLQIDTLQRRQREQETTVPS
jgi:hypothetical protein